jgi:HAD superfamily hydrolase (TIGR01456 family)
VPLFSRAMVLMMKAFTRASRVLHGGGGLESISCNLGRNCRRSWRISASPQRLHRIGHRAFQSQSANQAAQEVSGGPEFGFAFDIDGVLLHGDRPVSGASDSLALLQQQNIPFILLTNGGGKHEEDRVAELTERLGVTISTKNFVQSHTPFTELEDLKDKTILVTGSDPFQARHIAESYGFKSVITPGDIIRQYPEIYPFDPLMMYSDRLRARELPKPLHDGMMPDEEALKIDAVMVFNDPRDWSLDIQIILDIMLSRSGYLGTQWTRGAPGETGGQPKLFFSNPDVLWSSKWRIPRLGQGSFQAAFVGVWNKVTKKKMRFNSRTFGKPSRDMYLFAERVLEEHRRELSWGWDLPLKRVYMIGDNPESDIAGANNFESELGTEWISVLVNTGVHNPKIPLDRLPHRPKLNFDDVYRAVEWVMGQEKRAANPGPFNVFKSSVE